MPACLIRLADVWRWRISQRVGDTNVTDLKFRQSCQGGDADDDTHDLRAEPLAAEAAHYTEKDDGAPPRRSVIPRTRHETNDHR
ncbi:pre-mRNA-splicing factor [Colletotrichum tabaci]|uniref:Pre-mRNA-splicing factor n=1 Tax=Colletotrichum tabaci TaxID=1209068 RepID=A0AAV9TNH9_9PEZI